jgi:hypothetical protein
MNKYHRQNPSQPTPKKPAHLKKNPLAYATWIASKKARNQAQYRQRKEVNNER